MVLRKQLFALLLAAALLSCTSVELDNPCDRRNNSTPSPECYLPSSSSSSVDGGSSSSVDGSSSSSVGGGSSSSIGGSSSSSIGGSSSSSVDGSSSSSVDGGSSSSAESSSSAFSMCDGKEYDPLTQRCKNGIVENKCGDFYYDPTDIVHSTKFCYDNTELRSKCGDVPNGAEYDPSSTCCGTGKYSLSTQFCYSSSKVGNFCGDNPQKSYNPDLYECKPNSNGIYLKTGKPNDGSRTYDAVLIGEQVWMAENLNYAASGSMCGNGSNNTTTCDTYGRFYNWNTAMNGATSSTAVPSGVRGVCPSGWHLPSDAEWSTLMQFINPSCTATSDCTNAGKHLKASTGWIFHNGTENLDTYGFSALPGGNGDSDGSFHNFGERGFWWSATERDSDFAWLRYMYYNLSDVVRFSLPKYQLFSVRCLQD